MLNFEALVRVSRFKKMTGNVGVGFHSTLKRWIYILFLFWYLLPMRIIQDGAIIWRVGGRSLIDHNHVIPFYLYKAEHELSRLSCASPQRRKGFVSRRPIAPRRYMFIHWSLVWGQREICTYLSLVAILSLEKPQTTSLFLHSFPSTRFFL